ncbi:MAG: DUF4387 domain-containing protein [Clostridia bacterium]|nr:DUF4387 domain-containing protein [Clostridia bacterium]
MKTNLTDIAAIIRSKNAGPYELTLDILFQSRVWYEKVRDANAIHEQLICTLYNITPDKIVNIIAFDPANAIKITIVRPLCSGDLGETDVYGAQQHAPLLSVVLDV